MSSFKNTLKKRKKRVKKKKEKPLLHILGFAIDALSHHVQKKEKGFRFL